MSAEDEDGPGRREVAHRLFAAEFDDADFSYSESDEERAPNYVVTPTGARANRMFLVGVLTEVEPVGEDMLRARVVDPTGAFVVYAGQYQPDALAFLERAEPPTFLAVTGKARTFQPEDADVVYTSVRPETISEVDAGTRDRWVVATAEQTVERVARMARAKRTGLAGDALVETLTGEGVDPAAAEGVALALEHYDTTGRYLEAVRDLAVEAAEVVAGERDEVSDLTVAPDDPGEADLDALAGVAGASESVSAGASEETEQSEEPESTETEDAAAATAEPLSEPATAAEPTGGESGGGEAPGAASASSETPPDVQSEAGSEATAETSTDVEGLEESEPQESAATEPESPGAFETDETTAEEPDVGEVDVSDEEFDPDEFELDEDVREEIEEEYGTEFSTGAEVSEPGEAGIETPGDEVEANAAGEAAPESEPTTTPESEQESETQSESEPEPESTDVEEEAAAAAAAEDATEQKAAAEDLDLESAVMETMESLDDGDGVDRSELVGSVTEQYGASGEEVEEAIQDALMSGQCYEPAEDTLKPI